jgi:hypothetical protein
LGWGCECAGILSRRRDIRGSESERAVICPASLIRPRVKTANEKRDKAAAWGTLCHYWKECGSVDMPGASKADVVCLSKKLVMSGIVRDDWWPTDGEHEVTFAVNLITEEVLRFRGAKTEGDTWKEQYYPVPAILTGTADWVATGKDGLVIIDDLKTGRWPVSAKDNKQLLSYALPMWLEAGKPLVGWRLRLSITQWERYPLGGLPTLRKWDCGGLEMAAHLQDLRYALANPGEANPHEDACKFCESKGDCAEYQESELNQ